MRYAKLFFLLVWLFSYCPSAKAETERQSPDTLKTQTNLEGTITAIQDDPDSPDGNWLVNIIIDENTICRVSFPTPTGNPTVGADLQQFQIWVRRASAGGSPPTPTVRIELYENGVSKAIVLANTGVTNETGVLHSGTWNANLLGTADGSLVECYIFGDAASTGQNDATIEVGAVEWNVDYTVGNGDGENKSRVRRIEQLLGMED